MRAGWDRAHERQREGNNNRATPVNPAGKRRAKRDLKKRRRKRNRTPPQLARGSSRAHARARTLSQALPPQLLRYLCCVALESMPRTGHRTTAYKPSRRRLPSAGACRPQLPNSKPRHLSTSSALALCCANADRVSPSLFACDSGDATCSFAIALGVLILSCTGAKDSAGVRL